MGISLPIEALKQWCTKWRIRELSVFGSALRPDFSDTSDLDLLVQFDDEVVWDFDQLDQMTREAESLVGRSVDVVSTRALRNPFIRADVMSTRRVLYAA